MSVPSPSLNSQPGGGAKHSAASSKKMTAYEPEVGRGSGTTRSAPDSLGQVAKSPDRPGENIASSAPPIKRDAQARPSRNPSRRGGPLSPGDATHE